MNQLNVNQTDAPTRNPELESAGMSAALESHQEGPVARAIEQQTSKLPSDVFLWAALGAIACSAVLQMLGKKHASLFVGQWPPTILIMGLYNKLVKVAGSDRTMKS